MIEFMMIIAPFVIAIFALGVIEEAWEWYDVGS